MARRDEIFYVYLAGGLFTHKDLLGNAALAESIFNSSQGKFRCVLPQNFENREGSPHTIRDEDILSLLQCDMAIFNYDGAELDSGTVVEFMFAKFADIASLVMRTDFRGGGDCAGDGANHPWNLMASFYPRTKTAISNSASLYKKAFREHLFDDNTRYSSSMSGAGAAMKMIDTLGAEIVGHLDELLKTKPTMTPELRSFAYDWLSRLAGFKDSRAKERVMSALERKVCKGLI